VTEPAARSSPLRRLIVLAGGAASATAGSTALAGWFLGIPTLARLDERFIPMAPSTALLLVLLGSALCAHVLAPGRRWARRLKVAVAALGVAAPLALLILSSQRIYLGFEHLGLPVPPGPGEFPLGHMSPATALCLLFAGLSLLAVPSDPGVGTAPTPWALLPAGMLVAASGAMVLAYLFGTPVLYSGTFIPPAATAVSALLALGIAQAAAAWPRRGGDPSAERPGSLRAGLPILAFLGLSAGIVAAGLISYRHYEQRYRAEVERQLAAVAELKVAELARWREERLADAAALFGNPAFASLVRTALAPPGDAEARRLLSGWIEGHQRHEDYSRIALLDPRGVEQLAAPASATAAEFGMSHDFGTVAQTRQITFLDFHRHASGGGIRLGLVVPIFERPGADRPLGFLAMSMDPASQLYPALRHWPIPSRSAETLLARREGGEAVFLNDVRFRKDAALNLRIPLDRREVPAVAAVLGHRGALEGIDYRGIRVMADTRAVPGSPWFLVAKMDLAEVYAPLRERLWLTVALMAALLLGAGGGSGLLWRQRTLVLYRERLAAERERSWLRTVIARSLNEVYTFDATTLRFTFANDGACRNLGYSLAELLALTPLALKPRFDDASFAELVRPLREGALPVLAFETVHRRKDGTEYPVEVHLQLVDSGRGRVFLAVINDITERARAEALLRLNEARLEGLLEISEHGDRSEEQLLDFALHKALALTGSAVGYVYLYHEETRQFVLNSWSRGVMEACAILEKRTVYDLDTTGIWGEAVRQRQPLLVNDFGAANPLKQGYPAGHVPLRNFLTVPVFSGLEIVAVVGVANKEGDYDPSDIMQLSLLMESVWRIVERTRAEEALAERSALLSTVINSPEDFIIFAVDRAYRYTAFNEKHRRMMREVWQAAIVPGQNILELMTDPGLREAARASFDRALAGEAFTEVQHQPGTDGWFEFSWSPIRERSGAVAGVAAFIRDITARKRAEIELCERNAELERFIYTVSHDLKSPLVTVKTFLGYLEEDIARAAAERIDKDLRFMRTATDKMEGLLDDLLEMSRIGRIVAEPVTASFADLAAEAVALVAGRIATRGVTVTIEPVAVTLRGDRARLVEIWQNLVENAVKFMGDQPGPRIELGAERRGEEMVFFVRDNGIGIDARYREKIFGLFERLDPAVEGTGLGLALVKRIVELYGGTIRVESAGPGRGAAFLFTLPGALVLPGTAPAA
jgi:PAS domain S-box-containing protein